MDLPFFLGFFDDDGAESRERFSHIKAVPVLVQIRDEKLAEQVPSHGQGVGNEGGKHDVELFDMGLSLEEQAGVMEDIVDGVIVDIQDQVFLGVYIIVKGRFCDVAGLTDIMDGYMVITVFFK